MRTVPVLLKTSMPLFTIWTSSLGPPAPLVSGGSPVQGTAVVTPDSQYMPPKKCDSTGIADRRAALRSPGPCLERFAGGPEVGAVDRAPDPGLEPNSAPRDDMRVARAATPGRGNGGRGGDG